MFSSYGRDVLAGVGPILPACWRLPKALVGELETRGRPVPRPYEGVVLADTGCNHTCMSQKAADALELKPTRFAKSYGASGEQQNPVYIVGLDILMLDRRQQMQRLHLAFEVRGISNLEKQPHLSSMTNFGKPVELIGLLGRDLLRYAWMHYDGRKGTVEIDFDYGAIGIPRPDWL